MLMLNQNIRRSLCTKILSDGSRVRIGSDGQHWKSVIGLEVHAQIQSKSKLFSGSNSWKSDAPVNTQVSFFDASIPGTLPVLNKRCVELGVVTSLALNCEINLISTFDRKHYFYADLPTGYQITQQRKPLARNGILPFWVFSSDDNKTRTHRCSANIIQLQLEMDSGKSLRDDIDHQSLIDLNRCGIGLMEIVFGPDLQTGEEAVFLIKELKSILIDVDSCSCKMEDGALRVDANVSVNRPGDPFGVRTEVKNLNSLRSVSAAIEYEVERQIRVLESGGEIVNETRSFDQVSRKTLPMRDKESKQDYRFMPEPNLPPLHLVDTEKTTNNKDRDIINVHRFRQSLPELPEQRRRRMVEDDGVDLKSAYYVCNNPSLYKVYKDTVDTHGVKNAKALVAIVVSAVQEYVQDADFNLSSTSLTTERLIELAEAKNDRVYSLKVVMKATRHYLETADETRDLKTLVAEKRWEMTNPELIERIANEIMSNNSKIVAKIVKGKDKEMKRIVRYAYKNFDDDENVDVSVVLAKVIEKIQSLKE